jgi:hypothetical protein
MFCKHEIEYVTKMEKDWTDKPLIEHVNHVWYDHGNLFSSQVREEMEGDERAMELIDEFEDAWRDLHDYVLEEVDDHRKKIREQKKKEKIKERIKPFVHKKIQELLSKQ